jgi:hypothetical protein
MVKYFNSNIMKFILFRSFFLLIFIAIFILPTRAQVKVHHVIEGVNLNEKQGIYYALPRTVIRVDLTVNKTEYYAGPYAAYAGKYLDLENVSTNDYNEYLITEVSLDAGSEPDPEQFYFAEFDDKTIKESSAMLFSLSEAGLVTGLNSSLLKEDMKQNISKFEDKENVYAGLFNYSAETNLYERADTVIKKVVVDTVTVEKKYLDRKWVEKSTEQKAVEAANMVTKLRENRFNLLTGYQEVAFDAGTMAYMDKQLKMLEDEYLSLFIGITIKKTLHYTFTVLPDPEYDYSVIPVFVFSERSGVKDVSAPGGEKINLKIELSDPLANVMAANESREKSYKGDKGFCYRVPITAKVSIDVSSDLKATGTYQIAQFGSVTYLPTTISSVQFFPETGGLKNVIIE